MRCLELFRFDVFGVEASTVDRVLIVALRCQCVCLTERAKMRLM